MERDKNWKWNGTGRYIGLKDQRERIERDKNRKDRKEGVERDWKESGY